MDFRENLKLLIFDFDGTLFHLENMDWEGLRERLVEGPHENFGDAVQRLRLQKDPALEVLTTAELQAVGDKRLAEPIVSTLIKLGTDYHLAILTRNTRKVVERATADTPLNGKIYIVGRENTERLKPHPEGLQSILDQFKVSPDEAALIGDTYHDVEAAASLGLTSIVVRNERLSYPPQKADYYIDTIPALTGLLESK